MKKWLAVPILAIFLLFLVAVLYLGINPTTETFKDEAGREIAESIAELQKINLGDLDQWISIRGRDRANPVLLWLHGGPGSAQMPLAHKYDERIEEEFVVVHWDQRGAGKSNHSGFSRRP